jgi:hypothetical protein
MYICFSHVVLEARVGPRLKQRLGAGDVAAHGGEVQRRPLGRGLRRSWGGAFKGGEGRARGGREWTARYT